MAMKEATRKPTGTEKKRVLVSVNAPEAHRVVVTGDFTAWSPEHAALQRAADGQWQGVLVLPPGEYQYRLIIDGEWQDDPNAERRVPNPFGSENCVLVVR